MSSEVDPKGLAFATDAIHGAAGYDGRSVTLGLEQARTTAKLAISAYLKNRSASPSIGRVGVRPLEFDRHHRADGYFIEEDSKRMFGLCKLNTFTGSWAMISIHKTLTAAKVAAQADYEARIRSALVSHEEPAGDTQGAEPVAWQWSDFSGCWYTVDTARLSLPDQEDLARHAALRHEGRVRPLYAAPAALVSPPDNGEPGKYDITLKPFVAMMEAELHANAGKGDRPGWLAMSREEVLLEIYYHLAKLQKAVRKADANGIREYAADVANMSMMAVDICGAFYPSPPALQSHNEGSDGK